MRLRLKLHPDSRCDAATRVEVEVARPRPGRLAMRYFVIGRTGDLRLPPVAFPAHAEELWRHTCFEAFLPVPPGNAYYELNFSPSTQWSAYRFDNYRSGMCIVGEIAAPRFAILSNDACYEFQASLELDRLPDVSGDATWHLGLSAVIEEASGRKSYWALA